MNEKNTSSTALVIFSWAFVTLPLAWGILQTLHKAAALFTN